MKIFDFLSGRKSPQKHSTKIAYCPYCGYQFDKYPTRKAKCPSCKKTYRVRTKPITGEKVVLTEQQAKDNEREWEKYRNASEFERMLKSDINFELYPFEQLKKTVWADMEKRFGRTPSKSDLLWGISNALIIEALKKGDNDFLSHIYWCQSSFLYLEGKNYFPIRELFFEITLNQYRQMGSESVEIITCKEASCSSCRELDGKVISIAEAIKSRPLPCKHCTFGSENENMPGWCRCTYAPK